MVGTFVLGLKANPVDLETAQALAAQFMGTRELQMVSIFHTENKVAALYVFNTSNGFVIVSADDCETPIIGYSHESRFDPNDVPIQMEDYLQDFVARIQYCIENQIVADEITARQWERVKTTGRLNDNKSVQAMEPLLTTKWHQGCLYNSLCPLIENQPCGHAEVGCVAVAMGQIMNYWQFPAKGIGSHTYYSTVGGNLTADFGNTYYEWELMPDRLTDTSSTDEIEAVATLLFHCGVSVNMLYTPDGSGAHGEDVPAALIQYFKYSDEMHRETMSSAPTEWLTKIKASLDKERPVLYSGHGDGGHAFVCDGYDDNDLLHFNWGWGGNGDGYFALGNLNPQGHNYNNSNAAIFDITPDNEPHLVSATAFPPQGGTVEGCGMYTNDQQCILMAIPAENFEFYYWRQDGSIISFDSFYTIVSLDDIDNIEAVFSLKSIQDITASARQNVVDLTWNDFGHNEWPLLKQLPIDKAIGVASDGNDLYLSKSDSQDHFWKYTLEGGFVESFNLNNSHLPTAFTYDGNHFYCNGENTAYLYTVDLANHATLTHTRTGYTPICSYDSIRNGIWIAVYDSQHAAYQLKLVHPSGALIQYGPLLPSEVVPNGSGFLVGQDGDTHLVIKTQEGQVYDYDIDQDLFFDRSFMELARSFGTYIGKYQGKDAMFVCYDNSLKIFEIRNLLWPIIQYRLYRSDDKGEITMIADEVTGTSFVDPSWGTLDTGLYRYGISSLYGNGNESEIMWSNALPKGNYDLEEIAEPLGDIVQKVFENGQIVILKDGKKYNITGQELR